MRRFPPWQPPPPCPWYSERRLRQMCIRDRCILTDSLFYDTIMYSGFSKELVCENAFFFLMVTRDRKSTRLNSSHLKLSRMPSSA